MSRAYDCKGWQNFSDGHIATAMKGFKISQEKANE